MATLPRVQQALELPEVPGPAEADTGFVNDFVEKTNQHESDYFYVGDTVQLPISCDGFDIDPVVLELQKPNRDEMQFQSTVTLRPTPEKKGSVLPEKLEISGLSRVSGYRHQHDDKPLSLSLLSDDPCAKFISVHKETGEISLRVNVSVDSSDSDVANELYVIEEAFHMTWLESPLFEDIWNKYQYNTIEEGVLYHDNVVPADLAEALNTQIDQLAKQEPVDWHPGSNDCVRDLVHPSLYPFVRGESPIAKLSPQLRRKLLSLKPVEATSKKDLTLDRFGRPFEISAYQWLPSVFQIAEDGRTTISSYINNLDQQKYPELYQSLCRLFEIFLPRFERTYAYLKALQFVPDEDEMDYGLSDITRDFHPDISSSLLRGRELNVITKIVDYELRTTEDKIEGVFHVEGMSSDHIIMTGLYIADRDSDFQGADILFQRAFLDYEGSFIFEGVVQTRHWKAEKIVDTGLRPLGNLKTPKGRIIVFPNCHVHKLTKMTRNEVSKSEPVKRRIVVFWVVDPDRTVLTSREVPKQQGISMSHERALHHRILLMEERKKQKGKFNADRKISLCEH